MRGGWKGTWFASWVMGWLGQGAERGMEKGTGRELNQADLFVTTESWLGELGWQRW